MRLLLNLAVECGVRERMEAMFRGDKINATENRAVLHVALRAPRDRRSSSMAKMSSPRYMRCLIAWPRFSQQIRDHSWLGHTGKPIRNIINIGIGGSDLGPVMAYEAFAITASAI